MKPVQDMIDAIGADSSAVPRSARKVAYYLTGSGGIEWPASIVATFRKRGIEMIPIDQSDSIYPWLQLRTLVKDCEPGASSNTSAVIVARARQAHGLRTTLYTFEDNWGALSRLVEEHPGLIEFVDWWIANWNLSREQAVGQLGRGNLKAIQWASPSSNPHTIAPGSHRTLAELNVDLSVTLSDWPTPPARPKKPTRKPHPKVLGATGAGALSAAILGVLHGLGLIHLTPAEYSAITAFTSGAGGWALPSQK